MYFSTTMACFKIMTLNCQGLRDREKRSDVLDYLKCKKFDIYCIQDKYFTAELEPYVQSQWGYKCIFNSFTGKSRGVAVMLNNTFQCTLHKTSVDGSANLIALTITIDDNRITLITIYEPNNDNPDFFFGV